MAGKMLTTKETVAVAKWLEGNKDFCRKSTYAEVCNLIYTDAGVRVSHNSLRRIAKELGIPIATARRAKNFRASSWHDSVALLGKSVQELFQLLGAVSAYHEELLQVIRREIPRSTSDETSGQSS